MVWSDFGSTRGLPIATDNCCLTQFADCLSVSDQVRQVHIQALHEKLATPCLHFTPIRWEALL